MKLLNAQGMTLIEVMVAAGLVAGLAVAGMTLFKTQNVAQKTVEQNYEMTATLGAIRTILADKDNCIRNLRGKNPITPPNVFPNIIKVKNSVDLTPALYPVNSLLPGTSLKISSYQLSKSYTGLGAEETMLVIGFSRGNNVQMDGITKTVKIYYEAATAANAPTPVGMIHTCYAVTSGQSEDLWQVSQVDMNDIYYNSGDVGIGNSNPLEKLVIGEESTSNTTRRAIRISSGGYNEPAAFNLPSWGDKLILFDNVARSFDSRIGVGNSQNLWFKSFGPTADTGKFEFYTGNVITAPRMTIAGNGSVGIGTTTPLSRLTVNGAITNANQPAWMSVPVNDGFINYRTHNHRDSSGGTSNRVFAINAQSNDEMGSPALSMYNSRINGYYGQANIGYNSTFFYHNPAMYHFRAFSEVENKDTFWVKPNGTSTISNTRSDMYVSGLVGIGTINPSVKLQVHKPLTPSGLFEAAEIGLSMDNGTTSWNVGQIVAYAAAGPGNSNVGFPGGLLFKTKAADANPATIPTTKMIIDAAGIVGIGTTSPDPATKLHVMGATDIGGTNVVNDADRPTLQVEGSFPNIIIKSSGNLSHAGVLGLWSFDGTTTHQWNQGTGNAGVFSIGYARDSANPHVGLAGWAGPNGTGVTALSMQPTTGNTSIGSPAPYPARLYVEGDLRIGGSTPGIGLPYSGRLMIGTNNNSVNGSFAGLGAIRTDGVDTASLAFYTAYGSTSEKMRLTDSGNLGIGTLSPSERLHVAGNLRVQTGIVDCYIGNGTSTTACSSDIRLKTNITPIKDSLEKIRNIQGVNFDWKKDPTGRRQIGVIAQEVEKVFPEAVITAQDGFKAVDYGSLISPLIEAIKDFYQQFLALYDRVGANERRADKEIASLKAQVQRIPALEAENAQMRNYLCKKDPSAPFCK